MFYMHQAIGSHEIVQGSVGSRYGNKRIVKRSLDMDRNIFVLLP